MAILPNNMLNTLTSPSFKVNNFISNGLNYSLVDGSAGSVMTTDGGGNLTLQPPVGLSIAQNIYVSKTSGSDVTGNGLINNPYATGQFAINQAGTPTNPVIINFLDASTYQENMVVAHNHIYIYGPNARIIPVAGTL